MSIDKICGCKGIRTCLFCEKQNNVSAKSCETEENLYVYNYCSYCNLCWPNDQAAASLCDSPLYLGRIRLVPEFCTVEEESALISFIDKTAWMPSQSGRRKQDFGPKVNFKKKKVKIGEFKGFPKFTERVIKKLKDFPELSDFNPVELCNLEYTPERGSSIDPHVDDFWLWGERLVTINLNSSTVLTLEPCSEVGCECLQEAACDFFQLNGEQHNNRTNTCEHLFQNGSLTENSLKYCVKNSELLNVVSDKKNSYSPTVKRTSTEETHTDYDDEDSVNECFEASNSNMNNSKNKILTMNHHDCRITNNEKIPSKAKTKSFSGGKLIDSKINSICNLLRTCSNVSNVCVRIVLPPRSLFILAGCARYNWFHKIKRQDVVSRRLAMTFRELSAEFIDEGKESQCGKDLLLVAENFYDL